MSELNGRKHRPAGLNAARFSDRSENPVETPSVHDGAIATGPLRR